MIHAASLYFVYAQLIIDSRVGFLLPEVFLHCTILPSVPFCTGCSTRVPVTISVLVPIPALYFVVLPIATTVLTMTSQCIVFIPFFCAVDEHLGTFVTADRHHR